MKELTVVGLVITAAGAAWLGTAARNDQPGFREALERVPPEERRIFASEAEADKWFETRDRAADRRANVYFIPNDTRQWWQVWRPAYRPVYWWTGPVWDEPDPAKTRELVEEANRRAN